MTYIELINQFWELNQSIPFESLDAQVYMYLIYQCNKQYWNNPFQLPQRTIELELALSRRQIDKAKNRLSQRGLIRCQKGRGSASPWIEIVGVDIKCKEFPNGFVYLTDTQSDTQTDTQMDTQMDTQSDTQTEISHYIDKDNKTIRHKDNATLSASSPKIPSLPFPSEKKPKTPKKKKDPLPEPPSFDDVRNQFLLSHADVRLQNWELEARSFFDWFSYREWKDKSGNSILRKWQARANIWINDKESGDRNVKSTNPKIPNVTANTDRGPASDQGRQIRDESYARVMRDLLAGSNPGGAAVP